MLIVALVIILFFGLAVLFTPLSLWNYIWKTSRYQIVLVSGLLAVMFIIFTIYQEGFFKHLFDPGLDNLAKAWEDGLEALITTFILLVAVAVWYNEKKQDWENSLPKKLDIIYKLGGNEHATVKNVPLTSEQDIRPWAQSIAQTVLNKAVPIHFSGFRLEKPNKSKDKKYMLYKIELYLIQEIQGLKGLGESFKHREFDDNGQLIQPN